MSGEMIVWKPIEKALVAASKKSPAKFQTFLNRLGNASGKVITAANYAPMIKKEIAAGGTKALKMKALILGAAGGAALSNANDIKSAVMGSGDQSDLAVLDKIPMTESLSVAERDERFGVYDDATPGTVRGVENSLVDEATKTVIEAYEFAKTVVAFTGSSTSARAFVRALQNVDMADFDVYDQMKARM